MSVKTSSTTPKKRNKGKKKAEKNAEWYETKDNVFVTFIVPANTDLEKATVDFGNAKLTFSCSEFGVTINLRRTIDDKESKFENGVGTVLCTLKKKYPGKRWVRLHKENAKLTWLKYTLPPPLDESWQSDSTNDSEDDLLGQFSEGTVLDEGWAVTVTGIISHKGRCRGYYEALSYHVGDIRLSARLELKEPWAAESKVRVGWVQGISYMKSHAIYEDEQKKEVGRMFIDFKDPVTGTEYCFDSYGEKLPWQGPKSFEEMKRDQQGYTIDLVDVPIGQFPWIDPVNKGDDENISLESCYDANQLTAFLIAINKDTKVIQVLRSVEWKFEIKIRVTELYGKVTCDVKAAILGLRKGRGDQPLTLKKCIFDDKGDLKKFEDTINKRFHQYYRYSSGEVVHIKRTDEVDCEDEDGQIGHGQDGINLHDDDGMHPEDGLNRPLPDLREESDEDFDFQS